MNTVLNYGSLIAILRGISPNEVIPIGSMLIEQGWDAIEIPFQSEESLEAITILCQEFGNQLPCGAGTVTTMEQLKQLRQCQNMSLLVSPNTNEALIEQALTNFPLVIPGVFSPSELIQACQKGASYIKLFPASIGGTDLLKALQAIITDPIRFFAVGGVQSKDFDNWFAAGVYGFGIGSELYQPQLTLESIRTRGQRIVAARNRALTHNHHRSK